MFKENKNVVGKIAYLFLLTVIVFIGLPNGAPVLASSFAGGDGSKDNPYQISTPSHMNEVRNYSGKYFILMNDIDLSTNRKTREWQPIVNFTGTIDGNNYTIYNLKAIQPNSNVGLLATANKVTITNLTVKDVELEGDVTGTLIGKVTGEGQFTIENCKVYGSVSGTNYAGGLVGKEETYLGTSTIKKCSIEMDVSGWTAGGAVGYSDSTTITDLTFQGKVSARIEKKLSGFAGGMIGRSGEGGGKNIVKYCSVNGTITSKSDSGGILASGYNTTIQNCSVKGTVESDNVAGGILGSSIEFATGVTIEKSQNYADVSSLDGTYYFNMNAGGIAGYIGNSVIVDCDNYGAVSSNDNAGGIAGIIFEKSKIYNSNNYAKVNATRNAGGIFAQSGVNDNLQQGDIEIVNSHAFGEITGRYAGGIGGSVNNTKKETVVSSCFYTADIGGYGNTTYSGASRIGRVANTELIKGNIHELVSSYKGNVQLTPILSSDESIVKINGKQLTGVEVGEAEVTVEVSVTVNNKKITYTLNEIFNVVEKEPFTAGNGTKESPYEIHTVADLQKVSSYPYAYYKLMKNLDLYSIDSFVPIGDIATPFIGNFDGNGKKITGLTVTKYVNHAGLFGVAINAEIKNIILDDVYITTGKHAGAVLGYGYNTVIQECMVEGEIAATTVSNNYAGLVVGKLFNGVVDTCSGIGAVKSAYAGVFAGYVNVAPVNCYWYTTGSTNGFGQVSSASTSGVTKIDLGISNLLVEDVMSNVVTARSSTTPITNFKLYGVPKQYTYKTSSNTKVVQIKNNHLLAVGSGRSNVKVEVQFANGKKATLDCPVTVKAKPSIADATVKSIGTKVYTGKEIKPALVVKYGSKKLTSNDYVITYSRNVNPGKATITLKGKGNYTGTKVISFLIQLPKVSDLKLTASYSTVKISYASKKNIDGYEIYDYSTKKAKKIKGTSYQFTNLKSANSYVYKVRTYKKINGKFYYSPYSSNVSIYTKVKAPTISVKSASKKAKISWKRVSGANGYQIYMSTSKNGKYKSIATVKKGTTLTYTKKDLKKNKTYYFKVRAYRTINKKPVYGKFSSVKMSKVK